MSIRTASMAVKYKKIENLKKNYYDYKDVLANQFLEATILPIPDDAPEDIPRIYIESKGGHSHLVITPIKAVLQIEFDGEYTDNWDICKQYIAKRAKVIFEFLNHLTDDQYEYIGTITEILMDNKYFGDGAKILADNLLKTSNLSGIYDLNLKYTFTEIEKIFINITLQNARLFKDGISREVAGSLRKENQTSETIGALIDVNDRYGFNIDPNYQSDSSMLSTLLAKLSDIIENKLDKLVESGVY